MDDAEYLFRSLYIEAASACGDDPHAVERYVADRVSSLSEEDRRRFDSVTETALAFQAPVRRPDHSH